MFILTSIVHFLIVYITIEYYCINMMLYKSIYCTFTVRKTHWSITEYHRTDTIAIPTFPTGVSTGGPIFSPGIVNFVSLSLTPPLMSTLKRCALL